MYLYSIKAGSWRIGAAMGLGVHFVQWAGWRACEYRRAGQSGRAGLLRAGLRERMRPGGRALAGLRIDQAGLLVTISGGLAGAFKG